MKTINYKGKTLYQLPKDTTKKELERLMKSGAQFYIKEKKED